MKPLISIIVNITEKSRAIGDSGKLLAPISDDLKRFKQLTTGHPIIMGRKTFDSIGRVLPNRQNIIITRNKNYRVEGAIIVNSLEEAIKIAKQTEQNSATNEKEIFIIGGGEIYNQALPLTDKLYLTVVKTDLIGDTFFPDYFEFKTILHKEDRIDEKTGLKYSWIDLVR